MRYLILPLFLALLLNTQLHAQKPTVELSKGFAEPESGWSKVLQLKNGNTFYFNFTPKEGIDVTVFDKQRKAISHKMLTSQLWDAKKLLSSSLEGIYEIGGQPVIFIQQMVDRIPSLIRIKLDPATGAIDAEKTISSIPKYKAGSAWAMAYGGVAPNDFFVEKDPDSDEYAIITFHSFSSETDERISLIHYGVVDGKHKLLNKASFAVPGNNNYKYVDYIAMALHNSTVYLCTYAYNKQWSASDAKLILSKIKTGDKTFKNKPLEFTEDFRNTKGVLKYNNGTEKLQLLSLTFLETKGGFMGIGTASNYFLPLITTIEPEELKMTSIKRLSAESVNDDLQRKEPRKKVFSGLPQQMVINKDYSTTILLEEMMLNEVRRSTGQVVSQSTTLGVMGVVNLDEKLEETSGIAIAKTQVCNGLIEPLYVAHKGKGKWNMTKRKILYNNTFFSFDFVATTSAQYVIMNNVGKNSKGETEKTKAISNTNAICYKIENRKVTTSYLLGTPSDEENKKFLNIESSNYLESSNTYAALIVERNGREKTAHIAWIKF